MNHVSCDQKWKKKKKKQEKEKYDLQVVYEEAI